MGTGLLTTYLMYKIAFKVIIPGKYCCQQPRPRDTVPVTPERHQAWTYQKLPDLRQLLH